MFRCFESLIVYLIFLSTNIYVYNFPHRDVFCGRKNLVLMEEILGMFFFRLITRPIGQYARYFFFLLIGKRKSLKSLSNEMRDEYKDMGKSLKQDFYNAVIGTAIFFVILLIIIRIVFG